MIGRSAVLVAALVLVGCRTPPTVQATLERQTVAYNELMGSLDGFREQYAGVHAQLSERRRQAQRRFEVMQMLRTMRAEKPFAGTWAASNTKALDALGKRLRGQYASVSEYEADLKEVAVALRQAVEAADATTKQQDDLIRRKLLATDESLAGLRAEVGALLVVHRAIGDFLSIDLSPGAEALTEMARELEALREVR